MTLEKRVACRECFSLYTYKECFDSRSTVKVCSFRPFPRSRQCGTPLLKRVVSSSGQNRHYPHLVFCFASIKSSLQKLVPEPNFVEQCESKRNLTSSKGYADVYDGELWKEYQTVDGMPFLAPNCYGLLLNVDWFQPYQHETYSVGVIYISILNLPRKVWFKCKNIILVGIIPGPNYESYLSTTCI